MMKSKKGLSRLRKPAKSRISALAKMLLLFGVLAPQATKGDILHENSGTCGSQEKWFFGYNDAVGYEYQVLDLGPQDDYDKLVIGGRTRQAIAITGSAVTRDVGAFVMIYDGQRWEKPMYNAIVTQAQLGTLGTVDVIGVRAIRATYDSGGGTRFVRAFGVFETASPSLVFFIINESSQSYMQLHYTQDYATQGCETSQEWLSSYNGLHAAFVKDCNSQKVYMYRFERGSNHERHVYDPASHAGAIFEPVSLQVLPAWSSIPADLLMLGTEIKLGQPDSILIYQFKSGSDNVGTWQQVNKIEMDAEFTQIHGSDFKPYAVRYHWGRSKIVLLNTPDHKKLMMVEFDTGKDLIQTLSASFTTSIDSCQLQSFVIRKGYGYIGCRRVSSNDYYYVRITNEVDFMGWISRSEIVQFSHEDPSSLWRSMVTNILVSDNESGYGAVFLYSTTGHFAYRSKHTQATQCITAEPTLIDKTTLFDAATAKLLKYEGVTSKTVSDAGFEPTTLELNMHDDSSNFNVISSFPMEQHLNNPCGITIAQTYNDYYEVQRLDTFSPNALASGQTAFSKPCPDRSSESSWKTVISKLISQSSGWDATVKNQEDSFITISSGTQFVISSNARRDLYEVTYHKGLLNSPDEEVLSSKPYKMKIRIEPSLVLTDCTKAAFIDTSVWPSSNYNSYDVEVGTSTRIDFTGITNGNCNQFFSIDEDAMTTQHGKIFSQLNFKVDKPMNTPNLDNGLFRTITSIDRDGRVWVNAKNLLPNEAVYGSFKLDVNVHFVAELSDIQVISLYIKVNPCSITFPAESSTPLTMVQYTQALFPAKLTIGSVKPSSLCADTEFEVTNSDGSFVHSQIFTVTKSTSSVQIDVNANIVDNLEGSYNLKVEERNRGDPTNLFKTFVDISLVKLLDCAPPAAFTIPTISSSSTTLSSGLVMHTFQQAPAPTTCTTLTYTGAQYGDCEFQMTFNYECLECDSPQNTEDLVKTALQPTETKEIFIAPDAIQSKLLQTSGTTSVQVCPKNIGFYKITYSASSLDYADLAYTVDTNIFVTDNECTPDQQIDLAAWPSTAANLNSYQMTFGELLSVTLTGITNGDCNYMFSAPDLTSQDQLDSQKVDLFAQSSVQNVARSVDWSVADQIVASESSAAKFVFTNSNVNDRSVVGTYTMESTVTFANIASLDPISTETISFKIVLAYCACSFPALLEAPIELYQSTSATEAKSISVTKQNTQTSCTLTTLTVIDKDSGLSPDPLIFTVAHSLDQSTLEITVLEGLPESNAGIYNLTVNESHFSNAVDAYVTEIQVYVIGECSLCDIKVPLSNVTQTELDQETLQVNITWDSFIVEPIEIHGLTLTQQVCDKSCVPTLTDFAFTSQTAEVNATTVTVDDQTRSAFFVLPKDHGLAKTTDITFELAIQQTIIKEAEYANITLRNDISFEFIFVPRETGFEIKLEDVVPDEAKIEPEVQEEDKKEELEEPADVQPVEQDEQEVLDVFEWKPPTKPKKKRERAQNEVIVIPPLVVSKSEIDQIGLMSIKFNKPIFTPKAWKDLEKKLKRPDFDDQIQQVLKLQVSSGFFDEDSPEISILSYKLQSFNQDGFTVKINFAKPAFITQSLTEQDVLEVTFAKADLFTDKIDYETLAQQTQLRVKIPSQMSEAELVALQELQEQAEGPMALFAYIQLGINFVLAYGLKYLWNMVNLLQFLVFFQYWKINIHPTASMFITQIKKLALFEFVDTKFLTDWIKGLLGQSAEEDEIRDFCDAEIQDCSGDDEGIGSLRRLLQDLADQGAKNETEGAVQSENEYAALGSANILDNLGIMLFFLVLLLVFTLITVALACLLRKSKKARAFFTKIKDKIFWNAFIRFVVQSTLKMQLSAGAAIVLTVSGTQLDRENLKDTQEQDEESSLFVKLLPSILIIAFFNIAPIFFILLLKSKRCRNRLNDKDVKTKIGTMYATVDPDTDGSLWYTSIFLARRSVFVLITFALFDYPGIQIQAFQYISLLYLIYIHHWPRYTEKLTLSIETFNESIFLLICYHMVLFSNLIWQPELKEKIGFSLLTCIFGLLFVNTIVIIVVSIQKIKRNSKLAFLSKRQKEHVQQRDIAANVIKGAFELNENLNKDTDAAQYEASKIILRQELGEMNNIMKQKLSYVVKDYYSKGEKKGCCKRKQTQQDIADKVQEDCDQLFEFQGLDSPREDQQAEVAQDVVVQDYSQDSGVFEGSDNEQQPAKVQAVTKAINVGNHSVRIGAQENGNDAQQRAQTEQPPSKNKFKRNRKNKKKKKTVRIGIQLGTEANVAKKNANLPVAPVSGQQSARGQFDNKVDQAYNRFIKRGDQSAEDDFINEFVERKQNHDDSQVNLLQPGDPNFQPSLRHKLLQQRKEQDKQIVLSPVEVSQEVELKISEIDDEVIGEQREERGQGMVEEQKVITEEKMQDYPVALGAEHKLISYRMLRSVIAQRYPKEKKIGLCRRNSLRQYKDQIEVKVATLEEVCRKLGVSQKSTQYIMQ